MQPASHGDDTNYSKEATDPAPAPRHLPRDLFLRVLQLLPPNEVALSGRLSCKDAAQHFHLPPHCTVLFSQAIPAHAAACPKITGTDWQHAADRAFRQLPFDGKLRLLSTAAASGSGSNLELAQRLLLSGRAPSLMVPELVQSGTYASVYRRSLIDDPGVAAAAAGHAAVLLPYMLRQQGRWPVNARRALLAAAEFCDLEGLQLTWAVLKGQQENTEQQPQQQQQQQQGHVGRALEAEPLRLSAAVVEAACGSRIPDSQAKVEWLLRVGGSAIRAFCAAPAAATGNMQLLEWLSTHGWGSALRGAKVLAAALRHADLAVAQWLVEAAGCVVPSPAAGGSGAAADGDGGSRGVAAAAAAAATDGVGKLRWLQGHGVVLHPGLIVDAARAGQLETVAYLHEQCGQQLSAVVFREAAYSGNVGLVRWLVERCCPMDAHAYRFAADGGQLEVMRVLAHEARCPWDSVAVGFVVSCWPVEGGGGFCVADGGGDGSSGAGAEAGVSEDEDMGVGTAAAGASCGGVPSGSRVMNGGSSAACSAAGVGLSAAAVVHNDGSSSINSGSSRSSIGGGCLVAVQLLLDAGCPLDGVDSFDQAVHRGDLRLVQCLYDRLVGAAAAAASGTAGVPQAIAPLQGEVAAAAGSAAAAGEGGGVAGSGVGGDAPQGAVLAFGEDTLQCAAAGGCEAVVEWLVARGCGRGAGDGGAYGAAARNGDMAILRALRRLGVPWGGGALAGAVRSGWPLALLRWAVGNGMAAGEGEVAAALEAAAAVRAGEEVVGWLRGLRGLRGTGG